MNQFSFVVVLSSSVLWIVVRRLEQTIFFTELEFVFFFLLLLCPNMLLHWIPLTFTWSGNNKTQKWSLGVGFSEFKCRGWVDDALMSSNCSFPGSRLEMLYHNPECGNRDTVQYSTALQATAAGPGRVASQWKYPAAWASFDFLLLSPSPSPMCHFSQSQFPLLSRQKLLLKLLQWQQHLRCCSSHRLRTTETQKEKDRDNQSRSSSPLTCPSSLIQITQSRPSLPHGNQVLLSSAHEWGFQIVKFLTDQWLTHVLILLLFASGDPVAHWQMPIAELPLFRETVVFFKWGDNRVVVEPTTWN